MKKYILLFCIILGFNHSHAQEKNKIEFAGYVNDMFTGMTQNLTNSWYWQNILHNRLNLGWQAGTHWRIDAGVRNRFFSGDMIKFPGFANGIDFDKGVLDLSWNLVDEKEALLNTSLDRLFITFEKGKWCFKLGRQRVNWGQTFVWNANDLFNSYSFFDFDYIERPGCDAFRGTYYHDETSFSEIVVSLDHSDKITAAFLHHGIIKNFDYQIIAGIQSENNLVLGGGWAGDIKGVNFRGEFTYHQPTEDFAKTTGIIQASVGADYLFSNQLMLQGEIMYNNTKNIFSSQNVLGLIFNSSSVDFLSTMNSWNYFCMALYPVTPRFSLSASGMYMSGLETCFGGFIMNYSLSNSFEFSVISQYFTTVGNTFPIDTRAWLGFARLKYSF